jgi:hypothetical protein
MIEVFLSVRDQEQKQHSEQQDDTAEPAESLWPEDAEEHEWPEYAKDGNHEE